MDIIFHNGFESFYETFYQIAVEVNKCGESTNPPKRIVNILNEFGQGGLWILSKELTDKFELLHKDVEWEEDGFTDYFDELDKFLKIELYGD
jgi:hypothetical protein